MASEHWHHVCWNCGAEVCGGAHEYPANYLCSCGVAESEALEHIRTDATYDPEFARNFSCPA